MRGSVNLDDYVTTKEFARMTGVKDMTIRQWIRRGKIEGVKFGTSVMVRRDTEYPCDRRNLKVKERRKINTNFKKAIHDIQKFGWKIKEYGLEDCDDEDDEYDEKIQYVVLEKDRNWFYLNIWPKSNHMDDSVSINPHIDESSPLSSICLSMNVDELIAVTNFVKYCYDIDILDDTLALLKEETDEA